MAMKHYEGELGIFDYDTTQFEIANCGQCFAWQRPGKDHLLYVGDSYDGRDISIPDGVKSLMYTFTFNSVAYGSLPDEKYHPVDLRGLRIPDSATDIGYMCDECVIAPPIIPETVINTKDCAVRLPEYAKVATMWNIEHRGQEYFADGPGKSLAIDLAANAAEKSEKFQKAASYWAHDNETAAYKADNTYLSGAKRDLPRRDKQSVREEVASGVSDERDIQRGFGE